jgi:hypothetical protein
MGGYPSGVAGRYVLRPFQAQDAAKQPARRPEVADWRRPAARRLWAAGQAGEDWEREGSLTHGSRRGLPWPATAGWLFAPNFGDTRSARAQEKMIENADLAIFIGTSSGLR